MIQVDKNTTKQQLFDLCKLHCEKFLTVNKIPLLPVYDAYTPYRGFYQPAHKPYIVVCIDHTLTPRYNPTPRNQSFPNHKTDTTPTGVLAHEYGHAVDWYLRTKGVHLARKFKGIAQVEPQVTSYDTTPIERVAEAMRLFILNPDLLRLGRPQSYAALAQHMTPIVTEPWYKAYQPVSSSQHKYMHWATQWIKRGNKTWQLELF